MPEIDDLLADLTTNEPANQQQRKERAVDVLTDDHDYTDDEADEKDEPEHDEPDEADEPDEKETNSTTDVDEYGNEKEPENEAIRERLARQARKHEAELNALRAQLQEQGASKQVQKAAKDFEYDPDASGDWQQQLASFVKQTVNSMTREQEESRRQEQERQSQQEFESKFRDGMGRFSDFVDVMTGLPFTVTDAMTMATRSMTDPAAFLYAAAKRNPGELERISKLRDPYAQVAEMGRLEERMRKNKASTSAPKPLGRTRDDSLSNVREKKGEPTIEDLIAKSDAKRKATIKARGGKR